MKYIITLLLLFTSLGSFAQIDEPIYGISEFKNQNDTTKIILFQILKVGDEERIVFLLGGERVILYRNGNMSFENKPNPRRKETQVIYDVMLNFLKPK